MSEDVYRLKVVRGTFSGDRWDFKSIEEIDEYIVSERRIGLGDMHRVGTMEIHFKAKNKRTFKKIFER